MVDLLEPDAFRERLGLAIVRVRRLVDSYYRAGGPEDELAPAIEHATDSHRVAEEYLAAGARLASHVVDGQAMVDEALEGGEAILLEGQLGTMRDLDWGVYPYVTSSSPSPVVRAWEPAFRRSASTR